MKQHLFKILGPVGVVIFYVLRYLVDAIAAGAFVALILAFGIGLCFDEFKNNSRREP